MMYAKKMSILCQNILFENYLECVSNRCQEDNLKMKKNIFDFESTGASKCKSRFVNSFPLYIRPIRRITTNENNDKCFNNKSYNTYITWDDQMLSIRHKNPVNQFEVLLIAQQKCLLIRFKPEIKYFA